MVLTDAPMAQKWTQFVTSEHRDKVVQALDFRNRFADRPFLPSSLLSHEEIMVALFFYFLLYFTNI